MKNGNFGSEYNDKYLVVVDGTRVVYSNFNKKPALRSFKLRSRSGSFSHLVELWYQFEFGRCVLLDYSDYMIGHE